jgi:cobalamin biosynthesis protein CobW
MTKRIPATIITGFLGTGKTTLIRHLLQNAGGRRIAVIVNEFGDVGVDAKLLRDCGEYSCTAEDIVELANGCICCTVADDFIPTMETLLARDPAPDHIVIETSGLALPQPLIRAFNWPEVKARVTVDGVVTVIDARAVADGRFASNEAAVDAMRIADENLDHESPLHELFEDQLSCADLIVLNKVDLVDDAEIARVAEIVTREKRPAAQIVKAVRGKLSPDVLIGLDAQAEDDLDTRHGHHGPASGEDDDHDHDDFDSFVVAMSPIEDPRGLSRILIEMAGEMPVLRAKGFVTVENKPMRLAVQGVGPRVDSYFDRPLREEERGSGHLVIIGLKGLDRQRVAARLGGSIS